MQFFNEYQTWEHCSCGSEGLPEEAVSEEKAFQELLRETFEEDVGLEDQIVFGEEVKEKEDFLQEEQVFTLVGIVITQSA